MTVDSRDFCSQVAAGKVFEDGLNEMRRLLDDVTTAKEQALQDLADLTSLQRGFKLTWQARTALPNPSTALHRFFAIAFVRLQLDC